MLSNCSPEMMHRIDFHQLYIWTCYFIKIPLVVQINAFISNYILKITIIVINLHIIDCNFSVLGTIIYLFPIYDKEDRFDDRIEILKNYPYEILYYTFPVFNQQSFYSVGRKLLWLCK